MWGRKHLLLFDSGLGGGQSSDWEKGTSPKRLGRKRENPGLRASYTDAPVLTLSEGSQEGMRLLDLGEEVPQALCHQPFTGYRGIFCTGWRNL